MTDVAVAHDALRPLMFSIAYRMLGSVAEAEDVVQEAFLRLHSSSVTGRGAEHPEALAATITTRLAIDALRSARHRRERYVGTWLPEPLLDNEGDPAHRVELDETVSIAFLVVLESLSPVERAVFLLREVFAYEYGEIATIVGKTEANCRQLLRRAREHLHEERKRFSPPEERRAELFARFLAAVHEGDVAALEAVLAEDVAFYADAGGKATAVRRPVRGATEVARFVLGLARLGERLNATVDSVLANGEPALRLRGEDGRLLAVLSLEIVSGRITALRNQINPDKLSHLGPVGDLAALMQADARQ